MRISLSKEAFSLGIYFHNLWLIRCVLAVGLAEN
jgi:hypothetical protein